MKREKDVKRNFQKSFEIKDDFFSNFVNRKNKKRKQAEREKKGRCTSNLLEKTNIFVDTSKQERKKGDTEFFKQNARNHFSTDRKKDKTLHK